MLLGFYYDFTRRIGLPSPSEDFPGGPRRSLGGPRKSLGAPGKSLREVTEVSPSYKSYEVHFRLEDRSSSFLGVNVGLDPVRNLSKSGLKPDEDDQDA